MQLVTERLILREFRADDWPAVLAYQRDPRYLRYYPWTGRTPQEVQAFVQVFLDQQQDSPASRASSATRLHGRHPRQDRGLSLRPMPQEMQGQQSVK